MGDVISIVSIVIAIISLIVSGLSFWLNYAESKPRLVFSSCHISRWGKNDAILYSILENPGNKTIEIRNVKIIPFKGIKRKGLSVYFLDPVSIEKYSTYKLEIVLDENLWEEKYMSSSKIEVIIETVFGEFKKTFKKQILPFKKNREIQFV